VFKVLVTFGILFGSEFEIARGIAAKPFGEADVGLPLLQQFIDLLLQHRQILPSR
jgi:hypothetical protein